MGKVDSIGAYRVTITDSVVTATKSGLPQWVIQFDVNEKYVEDATELAHFKLEEPTYVDYSSFKYQDTAYFVLFGKEGQELANYEQAQKATGWDGAAFDTLADAKGKQVLIQFKEEEYNGKTSIKASWIDAPDASPTRQLKALDSNELKALNAKFITKKAAVKPAKPGAAKASPVPTKTPPNVPAVAKTTSPVIAPVVATPTKVTTKSGPPSAATPEKPGFPKEATQNEAWDQVQSVKGDTDDNEITDTWIQSQKEIAVKDDVTDEANMTPALWAEVRDLVVKDLKLA